MGAITVTSRLWQTNAVALQADDGTPVLVDSPVLPDELAALPERLGAAGAEPEALVVTHAHFDHVLGRAAFPALALHAGEDTLALLREQRDTPLDALRESDDELYVERPAAPDLSGAAPLQAGWFITVPAPGHAPDGTALYAEREELLLPGDYLCAVEIPLVSQDGSPEDYLATLDRLAPLVRRARTIQPGHGPALDRRAALELLDLDRRYVEALATDPGSAEPLRGPVSHRQRRIHEDNVRKHGGG